MRVVSARDKVAAGGSSARAPAPGRIDPGRLDRCSVRIGHVGAGGGRGHVIVASRPEDVFLQASRVPRSAPLVLAAHGITREGSRPPFLEGRSGEVVLRELGAYATGPAGAASASMRGAVRAWVDARLEGAVAVTKPSSVFFPSAAARCFQRAFEARAIAEGLVAAHPDDEIVVVPPDGALASMVRSLRGGTVGLDARARWPLEVLAHGLVAAAGALYLQAREQLRSRHSLERIRNHPQRPTASGTTWVALIPDLERINRHVVRGVALPSAASGELAGILLMGSLAAGLRSEKDLTTREGGELWAGLGPLLQHVDGLMVQQIAVDPTWRHALRALPGDVLAMGGALARLAIGGPVLRERALQHDLRPELRGFVRLATIDVLRARAARRATRSFLEEQSVRGHRIFFVGAAPTASAAACRALADAGATTIDFVHGAGYHNAYGASETPADVVVTWTELDAAEFRALGYRAVQGGMTVHQVTRSRRPRLRPRVLILTNYCHRDTARDRYPLAALQDLMLDVTTVAGDDVEWRWRAHPSDAPAEIARTRARLPHVELATSGALDDQLAWADVVVSSLSTVVVEALFAGVPVFVHVPPEWENTRVYSFVHPSRRFFDPRELSSRLTSLLAQLERQETPSTTPEQEALTTLFGPQSTPRTLTEATMLVSGLRVAASTG